MNDPIKFVRMRARIGESGGPRAGTAFEYEAAGNLVTVEVGLMQRSEDQLKRVVKEYIAREQLRGKLKNGACFELSAKDVEGLELFMKGSDGSK